MREITSDKLKVCRKQFTVAAQPASDMQYPSCDVQSASCVLSVEKLFTILTELYHIKGEIWDFTERLPFAQLLPLFFYSY